MSSGDEKERFEVTDYDLETEFNPNRFRKKTSKNQMIYGMWAEESDDEGESSRRTGLGRSKGKGGAGNYTSGQAFVSAGILQPPKEKAKEEDITDDREGEDDIPVTDSSSEEEVQIISSARQAGKNKFNSMGLEIAGMRKYSLGGGAKGFEMYGKGAKMLAGMGFEAGKGLGKDLQGISAPIEAHVRKGRGAIGAYGREKKTAPAGVLDPTMKPKEPIVPKEVKWQKINKVKEKVQYKYLTAEEVLEQKQLRVRPDAGHLAKVKVIDLTGPEQRILSGYHAISGQQKPHEEWADEAARRDEVERGKIQVGRGPIFDIPELMNNIELLKDTCEQNIFKNDRKAKYALDRKIAITQELQQLSLTVDEEDKLIHRMEKIMMDMQRICDTSSLDLENAYYLLGKLKRDHEEEWEMYQLYALVPAVAIPLVKEALKPWEPLENPQMPIQLLNDWAVLLGNQSEQYEIILWEAWMPFIRQANMQWSVKNAEPMVALIDFWKSTLPQWLLDTICDQILVPKLIQGVEDWDPLSDVIPIHSWIHPWLPHLGSKLEIVFPTIRAKLSNALGRWHPSDVSAKQIISPWVSVFSKGSLDTFLLKNIVPKLQQAMQELIINPLHQELGPWNWVMEWLDMMPIKWIVNLLETMFFPKWLNFLATWLNQIPHYDDVRQWYIWWRGLIPEAIIREPVVMENLQKGLEIIGAAVSCPGQPMDFSFILNRTSQAQPPQQQPPNVNIQATPELMADAIRMTSQVPHGFRDLVQMKCEELGLVFIPIPNRYYEGKQVYKCGNAMMYINANVIFVQREGRWIPMSLQQLIQTATS